MAAKIIHQTSNKIIIQVEIELNAKSMLASENQIQNALNEAGCLATEQALTQFDTDGRPISVGGKKMTSKGQEKKRFNPLMEK